MQKSSYEESMSTLTFGGRVSEIALDATVSTVEFGKSFEAYEHVSCTA